MPTWLSLGKAGPSNDAQQRRVAKESPIREKLHRLALLCLNHILIIHFMKFIQIFSITNNSI